MRQGPRGRKCFRWETGFSNFPCELKTFDAVLSRIRAQSLLAARKIGTVVKIRQNNGRKSCITAGATLLRGRLLEAHQRIRWKYGRRSTINCHKQTSMKEYALLISID